MEKRGWNTLVKTKTVQLIQQSYRVSEADLQIHRRSCIRWYRTESETGCTSQIGNRLCAADATVRSGGNASESTEAWWRNPDPN